MSEQSHISNLQLKQIKGQRFYSKRCNKIANVMVKCKFNDFYLQKLFLLLMKVV